MESMFCFVLLFFFLYVIIVCVVSREIDSNVPFHFSFIFLIPIRCTHTHAHRMAGSSLSLSSSSSYNVYGIKRKYIEKEPIYVVQILSCSSFYFLPFFCICHSTYIYIYEALFSIVFISAYNL